MTDEERKRRQGYFVQNFKPSKTEQPQSGRSAGRGSTSPVQHEEHSFVQEQMREERSKTSFSESEYRAEQTSTASSAQISADEMRRSRAEQIQSRLQQQREQAGAASSDRPDLPPQRMRSKGKAESNAPKNEPKKELSLEEQRKLRARSLQQSLANDRIQAQKKRQAGISDTRTEQAAKAAVTAVSAEQERARQKYKVKSVTDAKTGLTVIAAQDRKGIIESRSTINIKEAERQRFRLDTVSRLVQRGKVQQARKEVNSTDPAIPAVMGAVGAANALKSAVETQTDDKEKDEIKKLGNTVAALSTAGTTAVSTVNDLSYNIVANSAARTKLSMEKHIDKMAKAQGKADSIQKKTERLDSRAEKATPQQKEKITAKKEKLTKKQEKAEKTSKKEAIKASKEKNKLERKKVQAQKAQQHQMKVNSYIKAAENASLAAKVASQAGQGDIGGAARTIGDTLILSPVKAKIQGIMLPVVAGAGAVLLLILIIASVISALFAWTQPHTETIFNEKTATFEDVEVEIDADVLNGYIKHIKDYFDKKQIEVLSEIDWNFGGFEPDEYDYPYADRFLRNISYNSRIFEVNLVLGNQPVFMDYKNQPINQYSAVLSMPGTGLDTGNLEIYEEIYYRSAAGIDGRDVSFSDDMIPCLVTDPRVEETRRFMKNALDFNTCLPSDIKVTPDHVSAGQEITELVFTVDSSTGKENLSAVDFFNKYAPQFSNIGSGNLQYVQVKKTSGSSTATIKQDGTSWYLYYMYSDPHGGAHWANSTTFTPVLQTSGVNQRITNPLYYDSADYDNHIAKLIQLDNRWIKCNVDFEHLLALAAVVKWQKVEHPDTDYETLNFNVTDEDIETVLGTLYHLEYHFTYGNCPDLNCHEQITAHGPVYSCNRSHKIMVGRGVVNFAGTYADPFELMKNAVLSRSRPQDLETDKDLVDVYYAYIYDVLGTSTYLDDYENDSSARARLARMYAAQTGTDICPENAPFISSVTYQESLEFLGYSSAGGTVDGVAWTEYKHYRNDQYATVMFSHSETNEKITVRGYHIYTYDSQTGARKLVATIDDPVIKQATVNFRSTNQGKTFDFIVTAFNNGGNSPVSGRYSFTLPTGADHEVTYYYNNGTLVYTKIT